MKKIILLIILLAAIQNRNLFAAGPVAGITVGTPGLINLNIGFYGDVFGMESAISFLHVLEAAANKDNDHYDDAGKDSGLSFALLQLNIDCKIYQTENFILAPSVAGGTFYLKDENDPSSNVSILYIGPCLHVVFYGFFSELGVAFARDFHKKLENRKTHLFPLVQIGYLAGF